MNYKNKDSYTLEQVLEMWPQQSFSGWDELALFFEKKDQTETTAQIVKDIKKAHSKPLFYSVNPKTAFRILRSAN